jgi:hypothetical protein
MRPTDLQFRSPKEKTPDAYFPRVTHDGRKLEFSPPKRRRLEDRLRSSFSYERRFTWYKEALNRTGEGLGPGSYKPHKKRSFSRDTRGTPLYRPFVAHIGDGRTHYYSNGHLVSDDDVYP